MTGLRILATVGTDHHPFDRLVEWCDAWARAHSDDEIFIQYGTSTPPSIAAGSDYVTPTELGLRLAEADVVICHGGPATIAEVRAAGRWPIVVPRDSSRGEHVDDHQLRFAARVSREQVIRLASSAEEFETALLDAQTDTSTFRVSPGDDQTARSVRRFGDLARALMS